MIVASLLRNLLWALRYPSFPESTGTYSVGAVQTRIPGGPACQIHYPALDSDRGIDVPYFRPEAIEGLADYTGTSSGLLGFLSKRSHPCKMGASPIPDKNFPVVLFSHGLGGCYEMYTSLCQHVASYGYLVIAVEHEDGSGAHAESEKGDRIYYKRPDDTPYSRMKVVNFRRDFLEHRKNELERVLDFVQTPNLELTCDKLRTIMQGTDTSKGIHLMGHSFGGATMVKAAQELQHYRFSSLSVLDVWAFSLPDSSLQRGVDNLPFLSILSEAWLTNPETMQVQKLLKNSMDVSSFYIPDSVHASFSDAAHWVPGLVGRNAGLRAQNEGRHDTIRTAAESCVLHMQGQDIKGKVEPFQPDVEYEQVLGS